MLFWHEFGCKCRGIHWSERTSNRSGASGFDCWQNWGGHWGREQNLNLVAFEKVSRYGLGSDLDNYSTFVYVIQIKVTTMSAFSIRYLLTLLLAYTIFSNFTCIFSVECFWKLPSLIFHLFIWFRDRSDVLFICL